MDSIELRRFERRARVVYEWSRARRAILGFAPAIVIVAIATLLTPRPSSSLVFGVLMFVSGVALLWYGRDLRRAVLPGLVAGIVPLTLALCANRFGHECSGESCVMWCVPACTLGGLVAGLAVSAVGHRGRHGPGFWAAASGISLFTGAMGCACVGYSGVLGLVVGFGAGFVPSLVQRLSGQRSS
jgi:hypothetical protein